MSALDHRRIFIIVMDEITMMKHDPAKVEANSLYSFTRGAADADGEVSHSVVYIRC